MGERDVSAQTFVLDHRCGSGLHTGKALVMSNRDQFYAGVDACKEGWKCPEGASHFFQRGYGMQYAAENSVPPFSLEDYENVIEEMCHE